MLKIGMLTMYDTLKCLFFSGSLTLFANTPQMFEWPLEKIGFGALLFFIIWMYLKHILPKTHEEMDEKNKRIQQLMDDVRRLNELRAKDQKIIAALLKEIKLHLAIGEKLSEGVASKRLQLDDLDTEDV